MPNYRGSAIVSLRKIFKTQNENETRFLGMLDAELQNIYTTTLSGSWIPIDKAELILKSAVNVLYSELPNPYVHLGYLHAQNNLNGIYKSFLHFLTPKFVIEQSGKIWRLLFDTGDPEYIINEKEHRAEMIVKNYPGLPLLFREMTAGHIQGTLELTGAKKINLQRDDSHPNAWRWWGTWE